MEVLSATDLSYEAGPEIHQHQRHLFFFGGGPYVGYQPGTQTTKFVNKWMFGETTIFYIKILFGSLGVVGYHV